jgi:hypothetical protein
MPGMPLVMLDHGSFLILICELSLEVEHMGGGTTVVGIFGDGVQILVGDVQMIRIGDVLMNLVGVARVILLCGVPIRVGDFRVILLCGCDGQIHVVGCLLLTTFARKSV